MPPGRRVVHALSLLCLTLGTPLAAQDREYIAAWERAQASRPRTLTAAARIAGPEEPGTPLRIDGQVFLGDGRTPAADAIVFAYHTEQGGLYDRPDRGPHSWRLRGWARADRDGRFQFSTIRPGSYPGTRNPAHVHFSIVLPDGTRHHAGELMFADDPFVTDRQRAHSTANGDFGEVREVAMRDGVATVRTQIRVDPGQRF